MESKIELGDSVRSLVWVLPINSIVNLTRNLVEESDWYLIQRDAWSSTISIIRDLIIREIRDER